MNNEIDPNQMPVSYSQYQQSQHGGRPSNRPSWLQPRSNRYRQSARTIFFVIIGIDVFCLLMSLILPSMMMSAGSDSGMVGALVTMAFIGVMAFASSLIVLPIMWKLWRYGDDADQIKKKWHNH